MWDWRYAQQLGVHTVLTEDWNLDPRTKTKHLTLPVAVDPELPIPSVASENTCTYIHRRMLIL